jgi:adenylate kinase
MRLVCIFGISGVGKTTLIGQFVHAHAHWQVLSAGQILSQLSGRDPQALRRSARAMVERNQFSLADEILRRRSAEPQINWLLDAHSVIDNGHELIPVPVTVISRINPDRLVFLFDEAAGIKIRRASDEQRDRPVFSQKRIEEEQRLAWQTCFDYARELRLKLYQTNVNDYPSFASTIVDESPTVRSAL